MSPQDRGRDLCISLFSRGTAPLVIQLLIGLVVATDRIWGNCGGCCQPPGAGLDRVAEGSMGTALTSIAPLTFHFCLFIHPSLLLHCSKLLGDVDGVLVPTLVIWGDRDLLLEPEISLLLVPYLFSSCHIERIPMCSHWVPEDQPERVNQLIWSFLQDND